MRLASLPFYALAEVRPALDALWTRLADRLDAAGCSRVPRRLSYEPESDAHWRSGRLLLGQACGYDTVFGYSTLLRVVATPRFEFPGCDGSLYRSFIVVRQDAAVEDISELRGSRCAINSPRSHSGMNILRARVAPLHVDGRFFGRVEVSGSHESSLLALQADRADVASIDCITWGLLERHRPAALHGLRILEQTDAIAAPPFVTSAQTAREDVDALRLALERELADPAGEPARILGLTGIDCLDDSAYAAVARYAEEARRWGYDLRPQAMA